MGGGVFVRFSDLFIGLPGVSGLGVPLVLARGVSGLSTAASGGHTLPHFFDAALLLLGRRGGAHSLTT